MAKLVKRTSSVAYRADRALEAEVRFLRSWIEKPLHMGAVMPSGRALARTMAQYVDRGAEGPVIELGPGTGAVTNALIEHGVDQKRLILVEYNPGFCALLHQRYPHATVIQADAYRLRDALREELDAPASAVVSGLPLVTKPMLTRLRLLRDAFVMLAPGAPFVQFTYSVAPPIPKSLPGISTEASERIWMNLPPARVWVYRKGEQQFFQKEAEEKTNALHAEIKADDLGQPPELAPLNAYVENLRQALLQEPVLDGFDHSGVAILRNAFLEFPIPVAEWVYKTIAYPIGPSLSAEILKLISRFMPLTSKWRLDLISHALQSNSEEVRDAAIQSIEAWKEPELIELLKIHSDSSKWLAEYAAQVVKDLSD